MTLRGSGATSSDPVGVESAAECSNIFHDPDDKPRAVGYASLYDPFIEVWFKQWYCADCLEIAGGRGCPTVEL